MDMMNAAMAKELEAKRLKEQEQQSQTTQDLNGARQAYSNGNFNGFIQYGTDEQRANQTANLSQVGAQTGQNLFTTGQQNQQYINSLQNRRNGGDAVATHMMNQRNRNMANLNRSFAGKGIAGGVAGAAANTAQNTADSSVNSQLQTNSRQNDLDLYNYVKRQQKVEGEALAGGQDQGLAQNMSIDAGSGITVICGELHRQGFMSDEIYEADQKFGHILSREDQFVMIGYMTWAPLVVMAMRESKLFTRFIAFFGMSWANEMAGNKNILGKAIMTVGVPLCRFIGKLHFNLFATARA